MSLKTDLLEEPITMVKKLYNDLPCVGTIAIAAGTGFAVGGFFGSAVALGYHIIVAPMADNAIKNLFSNETRDSKPLKLTAWAAKTTLQCLIIGATAPHNDALKGTINAASGLIFGNLINEGANKYQDDLGVPKDSHARRYLNFILCTTQARNYASVV